MRKPWVIGLISIIPGLGLIVIGRVRWGIIVGIIVAFCAVIGLSAPWETISITGYTMAIIAWITQEYYAVLMAQKLSLDEAKTADPLSHSAGMSPDPNASVGERRLHKARQELSQLLLPGESLKIALHAVVDGPSNLSILFNVVLTLITQTATVTSREGYSIYLGITDSDLLITDIDRLGNPEEPRRIPLDRAKLIKFTEGLLSDQIVIDIDQPKPLHVSTSRIMRSGTQQLVAMLTANSTTAVDLERNAKERFEKQPPVAPINQTTKFSQGIQKQPSIKASTFIMNAGISALFLLIGYAIGFGVFRNIFIQDQWTKEIVDNILLHLFCWIPLAFLIACALAALIVLGQSRLKLSGRTAYFLNSSISLVLGAIAYLPLQLLLIIGAAF
jgi:hypothetical protein